LTHHPPEGEEPEAEHDLFVILEVRQAEQGQLWLSQNPDPPNPPQQLQGGQFPINHYLPIVQLSNQHHAIALAQNIELLDGHSILFPWDMSFSITAHPHRRFSYPTDNGPAIEGQTLRGCWDDLSRRLHRCSLFPLLQHADILVLVVEMYFI